MFVSANMKLSVMYLMIVTNDAWISAIFSLQRLRKRRQQKYKISTGGISNPLKTRQIDGELRVDSTTWNKEMGYKTSLSVIDGTLLFNCKPQPGCSLMQSKHENMQQHHLLSEILAFANNILITILYGSPGPMTGHRRYLFTTIRLYICVKN